MTRRRRSAASSRSALPDEMLMRMAGDPEPRVRLEIAQRLASDKLWRDAARSGLARFATKWRAASRSDELGELVDDDDELVRETAPARMRRAARSEGRRDHYEQYRS